MSSVAALPTISARRPVSSLRAHIESSLGERLSSTLLLRERAAPLTVPIGIAPLDALTGGLPRGALSEITGQSSSGRTGVTLAALAGATRRQELCALVDASDSFDPASAVTAGVDLERLLWVRCSERASALRRKGEASRTTLGRLEPGPPRNAGFAFGGVLEQVLKVTDLLLQSGGFGMVVLDLSDIPAESARRVPLTSWFRFRRAVEPTATVLLLVEQEPCAKTCASLVVRLEREAVCARDSAPDQAQQARVPHPFREAKGWESGQNHLHIPGNSFVSHAVLLRGMRLRAEVVRSSIPSRANAVLDGDPGWTQRKLAQSAGVNFELRAAW